VSHLIVNEKLRLDMGSRAKNLIYGNIGATETIINILKEKYGIFPQVHTN
jgi:hypothetical protein